MRIDRYTGKGWAKGGVREKGGEVVSEPVKPKPHYWGITVH